MRPSKVEIRQYARISATLGGLHRALETLPRVPYRRLRRSGTYPDQQIRIATIRAKVMKLDGHRGPKALTRDDLINRLKRHEHRLDPELKAWLGREIARAERAQAASRWEQRPLSTTKGLDCGRGAGQYDTFLDYIEKPPAYWLEAAPFLPYRPAQPTPDSIEFYPALDIKILLERGWLEGTEASGTVLGWPNGATEGRTILLISDFRDPEVPMIVMRSHCYEERLVRALKVSTALSPKAVTLALLGPFGGFRLSPKNVRFWPKADLPLTGSFRPIADST